MRRLNESESKRIEALADRDRWKRAAERLAEHLAGFGLPGMDGHIMTAQDYIAWSLAECEVEP